MFRLFNLFAVLCFLSAEAPAATIAASSCSSANVQTAINSASAGDTVTLPGPCSATWSSTVSIPSSKGITLDGKGAAIARSSALTNAGAIEVQTHATAGTRITNFAFTGEDSGSNEIFIDIDTSEFSNDARFRVDHCTFTSDSVVHVRVHGRGYGLIDHSTFNWSGNNEVIQNFGFGAGDTTGWTLDVTPGSPDALYIEDNTFTNSRTPYFTGGKTAAFYGAKTVHRFNHIYSAEIDQHGTAGSVGARWWESYHNDFHVIGAIDKWHQIRGGTGMIWGDSTPACGSGCTLSFWEEDPGYPAAYQVGRGKCIASPCTSGANQLLDPAYVWLRSPNEPLDITETTANQIVANRDYYIQGTTFNGTSGVGVGPVASRPATCTPFVGYWATDEGEWWASNPGPDGRFYKCTATNTWTLYYTPYTYPHPLITGALPPPGNLRVLP